MVYVIYYSKITEFEKNMGKMDISNGPGSIFYTVPNGAVPNWNCFIDSVVGTSLLLIFIMALGNDYNNLVSNPAKPFGFALVLTTFGFSMGLNCGNPINPV
jgi:glycerol uptake facilitator-like aquaporin